MKHTPGPWSARIERFVDGDRYDRVTVTDGRGDVVVQRLPGAMPEARRQEIAADGFLIAAAPELLWVCEDLQTYCDCAPAGGDSRMLYELYQRLAAAVRLAHGEATEFDREMSTKRWGGRGCPEPSEDGWNDSATFHSWALEGMPEPEPCEPGEPEVLICTDCRGTGKTEPVEDPFGAPGEMMDECTRCHGQGRLVEIGETPPTAPDWDEDSAFDAHADHGEAGLNIAGE